MTLVVQKIRHFLIPQDTTGKGDGRRGAERNRRAVMTGGAAALARVIQIGASLITVPLTLKYLGNERFGLWMTMSSVLAMAAFADFGVGNGVLNTVSQAFGKDDLVGIRRAASSGFAILSSIAAFLLIMFFAIYRLVDWGTFFHVVSPQARSEAGPALAVFATCFALNIALDVVQRVQLGLQQGYRYGLWQLCGSLTGFVGVLTGVWLHVSLPVLIVSIAGAPILATALNVIHFFGYVRPDLRPSREHVSRAAVTQIANLGGLFFVLQVVGAMAYSADNFLIDQTLGAVNVPEYAIPQRMFAILTMMTGMLVAPLWPAYGEAISRGEIGWVRHTLRRSLYAVFCFSCIGASLLLLLAPRLIHWWVGVRIHPSFLLLLGMAVWSVLECTGTTLAMFLNGATVVRLQIYIAVTFGILCVSFKLLLLKHVGLVGVPWSTIICYVLVAAAPFAFFIPRVLRDLESKAHLVSAP